MSRVTAGLAVLLMMACGACVSNAGSRTASKSATPSCPAGETLICEVRNTGRITHGSFSKKNTTRCSCDEARTGGTVIPGIPQ